jgi:hypothetical protein
MIAINSAIQAGGKEAAEMAKVMGTSVDQLAADFKDNAFDTFLTFLDRLGEQGTTATETLKKFKIAGAQNTAVLLTLAQNMDLVRGKLQDSSAEWEKNNARVNEAATANETAAAKFQILKNNIAELVVSIGNHLLPAIKSILTEINFALGDSESRTERFVLFMKAKFTSLGNILGPIVRAVFIHLADIAYTSFANTLSKGMSKLAQSLPSKFGFGRLKNLIANLGLKTDGEATSFSDTLKATIQQSAFTGGQVNPYQDQLDQMMQADTDRRFVTNALSDLFPAPQGVAQVAQEVKKVADELDRVTGRGPGGNPQGDRGIDTTLLGGSGSKEAVENVEIVQEKLAGMGEALTVYQQEIASFGAATFDKLTDFVTEFAENGTVDFKKFANQAIAELARIQLKALATKAILGLAGSGGKIGSFFGGVASFFGISGERADGGFVSGGNTYLVGERGPELFSPRRSGNIIPNDALKDSSGMGSGLAFTQVNHYDGNPNEEQMAVFAQQTKNSAIEGVMEIIAHGGQPAKAFAQ